jgi:acyl-CoA thioesterase-2
VPVLMDAVLSPHPTGDGLCFHLPVERRHSVGGSKAFLFGGVALGACISAAERCFGRPVIAATSQYLGYASLGSNVAIEVVPLVPGHHTTQARVRAHIDGREILTALVSLGAREGVPRHQWVSAPRVSAPDECPPLRPGWSTSVGDMYQHLDMRVAQGWNVESKEAGHIALWIRALSGEAPDRPLLAMMGDFLPASIGRVLADGQRNMMVNSLDNSMRFLPLCNTQWVLCDVRLHGAGQGYGHGVMNLYAQGGTLLAIASQSMILRGRFHDDGDGHCAI